MTSKQNVWAIFAAVFALVVLSANVLAAADIDNGLVSVTEIEVDGVEVVGTSNTPVAEISGDTIPVRIQFTADNFPSDMNVAEDVRVKAWISGSRENAAVTARFDVLEDRTYTKLLSVSLPSDLDDDELDEELMLNIVIESKNDGDLADVNVDLTVSRESYRLDVLDVDMSNNVRAGETLAVDVVLKNIGRQFADDAFVRVTVPELGIEDRAYFGDLSSTDQSDPDKENTNERRLFLRIPENAAAGLYTVQVDAFNEDSITTLTQRVLVEGATADTRVISSVDSKTFSAGETASYSVTIVNAGNSIQVYEVVVDTTSSGLSVTADQPVVAVPAGSSRTVNLMANADDDGKYTFAVNVHSGSELVAREVYSANVEGTSIDAGNTTVLVTVILAIVFVVLLVVLIVLLTRKPERQEELGESYY